MTNHTPTSEQALIIQEARETTSNLLINALAGAAKTTTLEMICAAITNIPILSLAFNKRIADEMTKRLPSHVECRTMNGLGHRVWAQACGKRLVVAADKMRTILRNCINELSREEKSEAFEDFSETMKFIQRAKRDGFVPQIWNGPHTKLFANGQDWIDSMGYETPSKQQAYLIGESLKRSIAAAYEGGIDFDDQIYMPVIFGGSWPRFPLVLIDEFQDLNLLQHEMLDKLVTKRLIGVGDPWQCHPAGTLITLTGGKRVAIEFLKKGSEVVSYFSQKTIFRGLKTQGRKIEHIQKNYFKGNLITITTRSNEVSVTPNHKCLVRMPTTKAYSVYLMRRDRQFRIGVARLRYPEGSGLATRARQEKAEEGWILGTYHEKQIARVFENTYSAIFGIPQLLFQAPGGSEYLQPNIDEAWRMIGDNYDRGIGALVHFGRDIAFPLWSASGDNPHFGTKSFITAACNLISGMYVCVMSLAPTSFGADKSANWQLIDEPKKIPYEGYVYGLTVEPTEGGRRLYLANNIVVHNSIYAFRGAMQNGMKAAQERWDMKELTLSVTFRVPQRGVERAWFRVPHMRWRENAPQGQIDLLGEWGPDDIPTEAAIICRNNAPLLSLGFKLLRAQRAIKLVGFDIGAGLVRTLRKLGPSSLNEKEMFEAIERWLETELRRARRSETVHDRAECLRALCENRRSLDEAISGAESLFKQQGPIQLLSGHKAKGLEWDTVFHLDPWRIPSKYAKEGTEEYEQELNVKYVIETRFKERLVVANLESFHA